MSNEPNPIALESVQGLEKIINYEINRIEEEREKRKQAYGMDA